MAAIGFGLLGVVLSTALEGGALYGTSKFLKNKLILQGSPEIGQYTGMIEVVVKIMTLIAAFSCTLNWAVFGVFCITKALALTGTPALVVSIVAGLIIFGLIAYMQDKIIQRVWKTEPIPLGASG